MKANTNPNDLPIGITLGDPAGIGPELAIKIMGDRKISRSKRYVSVTDYRYRKNQERSCESHTHNS